jgi:chromosome partitioning protein
MTEELDLVGLSEIADLTGFSKQAVANWRVRDPDFPTPLSELRSGPVWAFEAIRVWAESRGLQLKQPQESAPRPKGGESMAKCVGIVNMKGGVGKSTLSANLGWYCAQRKKKRVLLVDLDPQFNLSQYVLGSERYEEEIIKNGRPTVLDIFEEHTPSAVSGTPKKKVSPGDVICKVRQWRDERCLDIIASRLELAWTLKNPHQKEHLLGTFLKKIVMAYDLILIDSAPTPSILTDAAYLASDSVLVPVKPEFLSTIGLPLVLRSIEEFQSRYEDQTLQLVGIVFNSASSSEKERSRSKKFVSELAKKNDWYVFANEVSYSGSYPAGARAGKPIFLTDYARSWKVAEFEAVADEFLQRIEL